MTTASANALPAVVQEKLDALPTSPGVYVFRGKTGDILYVGKAKNLRSRVRSYFQAGGSDTRFFIPILQQSVGDLDTVVTGTEKEAAILENNLIKEYLPRYNVKLRDDKEYLSLRLAKRDEWPKLELVRKPTPDGARYFGPFHSATSARRTLHLVNKHFQLRTCSDVELKSRRRPCLQFQIKRCPAPCVMEVDHAFYAEQVDNVALFLDSRHDELSRQLGEKMKSAARALRFELAAVYRDQLVAIDQVKETQRIVTVDDVDRDVVGLHREGDLAEIALLYVRKGRLADVAAFGMKGAEVPDEELVSAFLAQHYAGEAGVGAFIPDEILLPVLPEAALGIADWLSDLAGHKVLVKSPERGAKKDLVALAADNARHSFAEKRRATEDVGERLIALQERLRLPSVPHRIECCDISHLGGGDTVGAVVALFDGEPDKKRYRSFRVRVTTRSATAAARSEGGDDYAAMYEVLARRFRRGKLARSGVAREATAASVAAATVADETSASRSDAEWDLPDVFVVDGGRGQLGVALAAARDLGLHDLPIVALAKEKETPLGEALVDRVYLPGQKNPIPLRSHSASLFFLARARDEAHRFANYARGRLGKKRTLHSRLDDVRGIGPITRKALLRGLGSLKGVQAASDAELLAVPGVTKRHVAAIRSAFGGPTRSEAGADDQPE